MKKLLANWGNYPVMESDEKSFAFEDELGRLVKDATSFIARGNGRCYGDAALAALTISTLKFDKILAFDPVQGIFECQSGILLDSILRVILPRGWFLPVTPGTKYITAGGAVASDIHGKNHHVEGSFSRHILELGLMLSSGDQIICSPQINPDLFEATCGGMGLTGIICRIKFRLKKVETAFIRQNKIRAENLDELIRLLETHKEATYTVAWIDCLQKGKQHGRGIVFTGEHALPSDLPETMSGDPFILPKKPVFNLPAYLPSWIINPLTVRSFNFLYYHKDRKKVTSRIVGYEPFFYPLDSVGHWNRAYGKRGFLQYQFVIPLHAREGLVEILRVISEKEMGSFLTVLKIFGKQESLISFPMEGFTLAMDFPVRTGLMPLLDRLDQIVVRYGGRVYMSKDARMKPEILQMGYPELDRFRQIVVRYNPLEKIHSAQSDRLRITHN